MGSGHKTSSTLIWMPLCRVGSIFILLCGFLITEPVKNTQAKTEDPAPAPDASSKAPLYLPVASATLGVPGNLQIGQAFTFTATFDNTHPTDVGYGPFMDVYFPVTGADGAGAALDDGIDFVNASFLGGNITTIVQTFPAGPLGGPCLASQSRVNHPYAQDNTGAYVTVCGTPGDKLVTFQLPFGSFAPTQTPAVVTVNAQLSNLADLGTSLTLRTRGGFQYGGTPLNDWCCGDESIVSAGPNTNTWPGSPVSPTVVNLTKTYNGPEDETATGPNYPRTYTVSVDIAPGQTVTNLTIVDTLPDNIAYLNPPAPVTAPGGAVLIDQPTIGAAAIAPNNDLQVRWPSVMGTASVAFSFFVPLTNPGGSRVINADTGAAVTSQNRSSVTGNWTPIDGRDSPTPVTAGGTCPTGCHSLTDRSLAVQKSSFLFTDVGAAGTSPGDIIQYTLNFQISDYFAFQSLTLTDAINDGIRVYDPAGPTFDPTLQMDGNGYTSAVTSFNPINFTIDNSQIGNTGPNPPADGTDGSQSIIFRVSDELVSRTFSNRVIGGCINPGTGSNPPDCSAYNNGATQGVIVFYAQVQDRFSDSYPSGDFSVDHGDVLGNTVTVRGRNLDAGTLADTTSNDVTDTSSVGDVVAFGSLSKSLYAINGTVCPAAGVCPGAGPYQIKPGDQVTYRIQYGQPSSDFEQTVLNDYLPLPVYYVGDPDANDYGDILHPPPGAHNDGPAWSKDPGAGAVPPPGQWKYGPADTAHLKPVPVPDPTTSTNTTNNTLSFTYAPYDDPSNITSNIDLLFTVTATSDPFTDRLFLTNQLTVTEGTTNAGFQTLNTIVQVILTEPVLTTKKGVVASSDDPPAGDAAYNPALPGSPAFSAPGSAGQRFSVPILSSAAVGNSDIANVDAGDLVTFVIFVENTGSSPNGAFDIRIRDTLMPGYVIPGGAGLNLDVRRGDGSIVGFTSLGAGLFGPAPNEGIEITDPGPGVGACEHGLVGNGRNVLVITYDLQVDTSFPGGTIVNTGTLFNYAGAEGGPDHTYTDFIDTATTTIISAPEKPIVDTSEVHTSDAGAGTTADPRLATIGEIVRYRLAVQIPEGTTSNFRVRDNVPDGMSFMNDTNTIRVAFVSNGGVCGQNITSSTLGVLPGLCGNAIVAPSFPLDFLVAVQNETVSAADSTVVGNYPAEDSDTYGNGTDVYFKFGSITNNDRDFDNEYMVIEFNMIVGNEAGNITNRDLDNTSVYRTGSSTADSSTSAVTRVRVIQPSIFFGKTIVSLPSPLDAGGVVQYRIIYSNAAGFSAAFEVNLTDALPAQLSLILPVSVTLAGGAAGVVDASAGNNLNVSIASVPAGGSVTVDYSATILGSVTPAQIITNTSVSTWTSLPGTGTRPNATGSEAGAAGDLTGERTGTGGVNNYTAARSRNFTIAGAAIAKQLFATSALHTSGSDVAIGEEATYALLLTLPEGTTPADTVVDDLPAGLEVVAGTGEIVTSAAASGGLLAADFNGAIGTQGMVEVPGDGGSITFNYTNITVSADEVTTNNTLLMRFRARVTNIPANQEGLVLSNSATNQVGAGAPLSSNAVTIRVVEPIITFGKTIVTLPVPLDAGGVVQYRITYANGIGAAVSTAMDVNITDTLPAQLSLNLPVSITLAGGASGVTDSSAGNSLNVTIASIPAGGSVTIDYSATIQAGVTAGQVITNISNSAWTSLSGVVGGERTGSGGVNDYTSSSSQNFTVNTANLSKQITDTSSSTTTGSVVVIGEEVTYAILLTFPEGVTPADMLVDDLPSGLEVVAGTGEIITTAAGSGGLLAANFSGTIGAQTIAEVAGTPSSVTFDFTNVVLPADNDTTNNTLVARFRAMVMNTPLNQIGGTLSNFASNTVGGVSVNSNIVDVKLRSVVKSLATTNIGSTGFNPAGNVEEVTIGEIVTYQIILTLPENTTDTAVITDTLDSGLAYVDTLGITPDSGITFSGSPVPVVGAGGGTITYDLGTIINTPGATRSITITYRVIVLDIAANVQGVTLDNSIVTTWNGGSGSAQAAPSARIVEPRLQITKTVDPAVAALGSVVTYSIEISHTNESLTTAYDVRMTDGIPTGLVLNESSVTISGYGAAPPPPTTVSIVTSPTQFTVYWSEFPLGETAIVTFQAVYVGPESVINSANVEWKSIQIDPIPPPLVSAPAVPQSIHNINSTERRYDPLDAAGINNYVASSSIRLATPPRLPRTGFAPRKVTELPRQPAALAYAAQGDLWIEIPRLGEKLDVVGVPFDGDYEWNLTWLGDQAGWLEGTAYPTRAGNAAITAHTYLPSGEAGPFVNLGSLKYGELIIVHFAGQKYVYEVRENRQVRPDSVAYALQHEEYPWLTLITCRTYSENTDDYVYRVVVRAIQVKVEPE